MVRSGLALNWWGLDDTGWKRAGCSEVPYKYLKKMFFVCRRHPYCLHAFGSELKALMVDGMADTPSRE